jgi:hypothetical protein
LQRDESALNACGAIALVGVFVADETAIISQLRFSPLNTAAAASADP